MKGITPKTQIERLNHLEDQMNNLRRITDPTDTHIMHYNRLVDKMFLELQRMARQYVTPNYQRKLKIRLIIDDKPYSTIDIVGREKGKEALLQLPYDAGYDLDGSTDHFCDLRNALRNLNVEIL